MHAMRDRFTIAKLLSSILTRISAENNRKNRVCHKTIKQSEEVMKKQKKI